MMSSHSDDLNSDCHETMPPEITLNLDPQSEPKLELSSFYLATGTDCCASIFSEQDALHKAERFAHILCIKRCIEDAFIFSSSDEPDAEEQNTLDDDGCSFSSLHEIDHEIDINLEEKPGIIKTKRSRCAYIKDLMTDDLRLFYHDIEQMRQSEIVNEGESDDIEPQSSSHMPISLEQEYTTNRSAYIKDLLKDDLMLFHQDIERRKSTPMDDWAMQCLPSFHDKLLEEEDDDAASYSSFSTSSYSEEIPPLEYEQT